mgnify:CR=1 FL=1
MKYFGTREAAIQYVRDVAGDRVSPWYEEAGDFEIVHHRGWVEVGHGIKAR